jgi:hypothetical protein
MNIFNIFSTFQLAIPQFSAKIASAMVWIDAYICGLRLLLKCFLRF